MRKFVMAAALLAVAACGDKPAAKMENAPAMAPTAGDSMKMKGDSMAMKSDSMNMKADSMKMKGDSMKMAAPKKP